MQGAAVSDRAAKMPVRKQMILQDISMVPLRYSVFSIDVFPSADQIPEVVRSIRNDRIIRQFREDRSCDMSVNPGDIDAAVVHSSEFVGIEVCITGVVVRVDFHRGITVEDCPARMIAAG